MKNDATHKRMRMIPRTVNAVGNLKRFDVGGASLSPALDSVTTADPFGPAATASPAAPLGSGLTASATDSPGCVATGLTSESAMGSSSFPRSALASADRV